MSGDNDNRDGAPGPSEDPVATQTRKRNKKAEGALDLSHRGAVSESSLADSINLDLWPEHAQDPPEPGAPEGPLKIGDSDEAHHATSEALARFLADRYDSELPSSLFPRGVDRTSPLSLSRPELDAPQRFEGALARVQSGAVSTMHREPSLLTVPLDHEDLDGMLSAPTWDDDDWGEDEDGSVPPRPEGAPLPFGPGEVAASFSTDDLPKTGTTEAHDGDEPWAEPLPPVETDRFGTVVPAGDARDTEDENLSVPHVRAAVEASLPPSDVPARRSGIGPRDPDAPQLVRRSPGGVGPGGFGRGLTQPYAVGTSFAVPSPLTPPPRRGSQGDDEMEAEESVDLQDSAELHDSVELFESQDENTPHDRSRQETGSRDGMAAPSSSFSPVPLGETSGRSRWLPGLGLGLLGVVAAVGFVVMRAEPQETATDTPPISAAQTSPPLWDPPVAPAPPPPAVPPPASSAEPPPVAAGPPQSSFVAVAASEDATGSTGEDGTASGDETSMVDAPAFEIPPAPLTDAAASLTPPEQIIALCQERDGVEARRIFRALRGSDPRKQAIVGCRDVGIDLNAETEGPTAAEYLVLAQDAYAAGEIGRAYLLARNSSRQDRNSEALLLMGKAACDLGEKDKVEHVYGMLIPRDKRKLQRYCARKGIWPR